jgi:uncharacterized membrane protein
VGDVTEAEVQAARRDRGARRIMHHWDFHPDVRSQRQELSLGERAADALRNGMGSWTFVFSALGFLTVWMILNIVDEWRHWDPYPFILLNLTLSCLAALQGAILLIAAKRSDAIAADLAKHDLDSDLRTEEIITQLHADFATLRSQLAKVYDEVTDG